MFVDVERAHFNFLAVTNAATTRNLVRLATDQNVPTNAVGGTAVWTRSIGRASVVSAGADWRWIDGDSVEDAYNAAAPQVIVPPVTIVPVLNVHRISGGTQQISGGYVQDRSEEHTSELQSLRHL